MSDGWDPWEPQKPEGDEAEWGQAPEPEQPKPDTGDYGWGDYPEWPVGGSASSEYAPYGQQPTYGAEAPLRTGSRSHDPLGKLFPGLSRRTRVFLDWVLTIAGAILIVVAIKHWVVNPYRIPSSSMEPYLNCARPGPGCLGGSSDRVLACRICLDFSSPSRGDVIVFNTPKAAATACGVDRGETFVKRLIGLPGETVREDRRGYIWVRGPNSKNFVKLNEPYISSKVRAADTGHRGQEWGVPAGQYFMMGDNRSQSCDSRQWGAVPRNDLIGTVFFVYWPPDRISFK